MKTYSPKQSEIQRKWYLIDAEGKTPGRIGTKIADLLRGKQKPSFSPHLDCGDYVVVINAAKIKLTGKKLEQKNYYRHSGFPGSLKVTPADKMMDKKPTFILEHAIAGMIPRNKLKKDILKKLKIYADNSHTHEAQNPETISL